MLPRHASELVNRTLMIKVNLQTFSRAITFCIIRGVTPFKYGIKNAFLRRPAVHRVHSSRLNKYSRLIKV